MVGEGLGSATISGTSAVSGSSTRGDLWIRAGTEEIAFDYVIVGRKAWFRASGVAWTAVPSVDSTQPLNPFALLDGDQLEYEGTDTVGGRSVHRLFTRQWIGEDPALSPDWDEVAIESSETWLFVDDNGIPVRIGMEFVVDGTRGGVKIRLAYEVEYSFSRVGVPVRIRPPRGS